MARGSWLSCVTCARSNSYSDTLPTCLASFVWFSTIDVCATDESVIDTSWSARMASKYAAVASSAACARCAVTSMFADRSCAFAASFCALMRPPAYTFCENASATFH